jgi:aspartate racemase
MIAWPYREARPIQRKAKMHIGLIGGIGPAATVFYYERIVKAFDAAQQHLELTIAHTSARMLSANVRAGRVEEQVNEYVRVTRQLAAAGVDAVAITSMGGHFCAQQFAAVSPLPIIDGPTAVADKLKAMGLDRIGILGTRVVMQTALYGSLRDLHPVVPNGALLDQVNDDYVAMAIAGKANADQRQRLLDAGDSLIRNNGASAILLGGTDLNLVFKEDLGLSYPVIDSAAVHVDAIAAAALNAAPER